MHKISNKILQFLIPVTLLTILVLPVLTFGQGGDTQPTPGGDTQPKPQSVNIKIDNPFKSNSVKGLIEVIVNDILIPIGSVVAVLMVMYAGFLFVTARGDTGQIKKAKDALLWAIIGAAILLGAWVITEAIQGTINELRK